MDLTADINRALARSRVKANLQQMLATLPAADRVTVLIDLLAEAQPSEGAPGAREPVAPTTKAPAARKRGRPTKRQNASGKRVAGRTDKVVAVLADHPGLPIRQLSEKVYGDSSKQHQNQTRALLTALKSQGRVNNPQTGHWEVVAAD